ncbi:MAG: SusC/RagA family TonB-linked outer membrane protein, partial [Bacteroidales bacterium]|nr:SusC/RagA family TonB-linked outer membrane protein [Bacteroidales bacterium]
GVVSDANGKYVITAPDANAVLVFSSVGYASQEITVGVRRTIDVALSEEATTLDEVVVVAYGTARKRDLTGSVSTVDTKLLTAQSNSSVSRALEGAVAGLQVSATEGQPGLDMQIRVRGLGSTNEGSAFALVVIDGVPSQIANVLTTINPEDIATVTVLKDAASTALYGSRGANGVVLITTKKGESGKAKISVNARWGINTMTNNMPDLMRDPAAIYEHMWLLHYNTYRYQKDGVVYQNNNYSNSVGSPEHSHDEAALFASQHLFDYSGNSQSLTRNDLGNWMLFEFPGWNDPSNYVTTGTGDSRSATMQHSYLVGTDGKLNPAAKLRYNDTFYDNLLESRFRQEYNMSIGGGTDKLDYHVSLAYLQDPSYLSISKFDRYTGRAVVNAKVTDWFKAGANVAYAYRQTSGNSTRNDTGVGLDATTNIGDGQENIFTIVNGVLPLVQLYARDADGNYIMEDGKKKVHSVVGDSYSPLGLTSTGANTAGDVLARMESDKAQVLAHDLTARTYAEVKFLKDFTFTANLATDATFARVTNYRTANPGGRAAGIGAFNKQNGTYINFNTQQLLNWSHDFGVHRVTALAGHEFNKYTYEMMRYTSSHELIPGYIAYANFVGRYTVGGTRYPTPGGDQSKLVMESYFASANYVYDNKYYASASLRRDGSSKFKHTEDRWGTFWSIGGGWRITGEDFMKGTTDVLNNLKIRASYGVIGNQNGIGTYGSYQTWGYSAASYASATNGVGTPASYSVSPGGFVNENLTWENVHTTDIGVEFDLINRIHGSIDWYSRETVNAFYANRLSYAAEAFAGTTSLTMNNAKIRNRGVEIDVNVDIIRTKDIYWSIGLNGTAYNTILTKLPDGQGDENYDFNTVSGTEYLSFYRGEGKPYYNAFMYKYEGPDPNTGVPLYRHKVSAADHAGGFFTNEAEGAVIKTANYSRIVATDRVELGDVVPDWIGGFNTSFRYKNFDVSAVFAYQLGGKFFHRELIYTYEADFARDAARPIQNELIGNTWTPENKGAKFPIAMHNKSVAAASGIAVANGPQPTTDLLLFSASYFNVKNITLGYTLPASLTGKVGVNNLRVYVSADNLYMKSAYKGMDPRMSLTGGSALGAYPYPYLRVFNLGVNFDF